MEGFGPEKMIFILLILLLVFGAKRLPEIGTSLGKGIREFKKSMRGDEEYPPQQPVYQQPVYQQQLQAQAQPQQSLPAAAPAPAVQATPVQGATTQA